MKRNIIILIIFLFPIILLANAGSALVWFSFFHLILVNLFIGFVEILIYFIFDLLTRKISLVISNYISMIIGYYFIAPYFSKIAGNDDLWAMQMTLGDKYELKGFLFGFFIAFIVTLIIEFPFHYFSVYKNSDNVDIKQNKFLKAFFISNIFTYISMFLIYLLIVYKKSVW